MVDISGSVAKKTVHFDQPMRGSDLIAAVRATAGADFHEEKKYDDGMLHLVGYDDKADDDAQEMRSAEARYLQKFASGLTPRAAP